MPPDRVVDGGARERAAASTQQRAARQSGDHRERDAVARLQRLRRRSRHVPLRGRSQQPGSARAAADSSAREHRPAAAGRVQPAHPAVPVPPCATRRSKRRSVPDDRSAAATRVRTAGRTATARYPWVRRPRPGCSRCREPRGRGPRCDAGLRVRVGSRRGTREQRSRGEDGSCSAVPVSVASGVSDFLRCCATRQTSASMQLLHRRFELAARQAIR